MNKILESLNEDTKYPPKFWQLILLELWIFLGGLALGYGIWG